MHLAGLLLMAVTVVAMYLQGLSGPFLLDDYASVIPLSVENRDFSSLKNVIFSDNTGPLGRPLTISTFVLNKLYAETGSAFAFKATNVALHIICAILIFHFLKLVFSHSTRHGDENAQLIVNCAALLCTAAWALHPIQVSTVLYVVQRMVILSAIFSLLALITYAKLRLGQYSSVKQLGAALLIGVFTCLAVLSKENGILVIPIIALLEICLFRFRQHDGSLMRRFRSAFIASTILLAVIFISGTVYVWDNVMAGYSERGYGVVQRLLSQAGALLLYLKMILLPNLSDMSLYHDGFSIPESIDSGVVSKVLILLCIALSAVISISRFPIYAFGIGLFLTSHLIESTALPLEPVFEHRNYLAVVGILMPIIWYLGLWLQRTTTSRITLAVVLIAVSFLSSQTFVRAFEWSDYTIVLKQAIQDKPKSVRARNRYTSQLALSGDLAKVIEQLKSNQADLPEYSHFIIQEMLFARASGDYEPNLQSRALLSLENMPVRANDVAALYDLLIHARKSQLSREEMGMVLMLYKRAIDNPVKHLKPTTESILYEQYAIVLQTLHEFDSALAAVDRSLIINPGSVHARLTRSHILADDGKLGESQRELDVVRKLDGEVLFPHYVKNLQQQILNSRQAENTL